MSFLSSWFNPAASNAIAVSSPTNVSFPQNFTQVASGVSYALRGSAPSTHLETSQSLGFWDHPDYSGPQSQDRK